MLNEKDLLHEIKQELAYENTLYSGGTEAVAKRILAKVRAAYEGWLPPEKALEMAGLMRELAALHRERNGEVWYWQKDDNHLESLTCPILIDADDMRILINDLAQSGADAVQQARADEVHRIIRRIESRKGFLSGTIENTPIVEELAYIISLIKVHHRPVSVGALPVDERKEGRREVVEWIEHTFSPFITKATMSATNTWQAKLTEWGLAPKKDGE